MKSGSIFPVPENEEDRVKALHSYSILDTKIEESFDRLTRLAALITNTPIALISLVDSKRQWFKSSVGLDVKETERKISFCQYAILENQIYIVEDASANPLFKDNPLVTGEPHIQFYAGYPLIDTNGFTLGTLCVIDKVPRTLTESQQESLKLISFEVVDNIISRKEKKDLLIAQSELILQKSELDTYFHTTIDLFCITDLDGKFLKLSDSWTRHLGYSAQDLQDRDFIQYIHKDDIKKSLKHFKNLSHKKLLSNFVSRFKLKTGEYRSLEWNAIVKDGLVYASARDITERIALEEKLKYERDLFTDGPVITIEWSPGENNPVKFVSKNVDKVMGYSQDEMLSKDFYYMEHIHPDDLQSIKKEIQNYTIIKARNYDLSYRFKIKNGDYHWFYEFNQYEYDEDGKISSIRGYLFDQSKVKETELELNEARIRLESIIKAIPDIIFRFNEDGIFIDSYANNPSQLLFPADFFLNKNVRDVMPPEFSKFALEKIKEAFRTNTLVVYNYKLPDPETGTLKYFEARMVKSGDTEVVCIIRDETEEKISIHQLEESQRKIKSIVDEVTDVIWSMTYPDLELIFVTPSIFKLFGYPIESWEKDSKLWEIAMHPEDRIQIPTMFQDLENTGSYIREYRILTADKQIKWVRNKAQLIRSNSGEPYRLDGIVTDITAHKEYEFIIIRNERMLAAISKATAELLSNTDLKESIEKSLEMVGKSIDADLSYYFKLEHSEEGYFSTLLIEFYKDGKKSTNNNPRIQYISTDKYEAIKKELLNFKTYQNTLDGLPQDSNLKNFLIEQGVKSFIIVPVDFEGNLFGFLGFDMFTESKVWKENEISLLASYAGSIAAAKNRKLLEEDLVYSRIIAEIANQSKSEFLANMSHEIRTPLNSVLGFSDLLLMTEMDETQSQYIQAIQIAGDSLLSLINDILDFSKIESGKMELVLEQTNLQKLCEQIFQMFQYQIKDKNIELLLNISKDVDTNILVDLIRLRQILVNLLGNAIKFTEKGKVELNIRSHLADIKDKSILEFTISDTGIGIPLEKQKMIFEAFSQGDGSTTRKYGGTGLGLAICTKLLNLMDSELELESELGVGSHFSFKLLVDNISLEDDPPYTMDANDKNLILEKEIIHQKKATPLKKSYTILITDDNSLNRMLASHMIQVVLPDSKIIETKNGHECVDKFKSEDIDLILMDLQMPIMGGYEATRIIRNLEKGKHVPILALTAGTAENEKEKCLEQGMDGYLSKPLELKHLKQALSKWLF